jgi:lipoate-protein ligase A
LQHGTLPLYGDVTRIVDALVYETETDRGIARQKVAARATTLEEIAGRQIDWQTVADALTTGFAKTFGLELVETALTAHEAKRAAELRALVYADPVRRQSTNHSSAG